MQFIVLSNFTATAVIITISAMILLSHKHHRDKEKGRNDVLPSTSSSPSNGLYITAIVLSMSLLAFYRYPVTQARPNLLPNVLSGSYASSQYQNSLAVFVATAKEDYGQGALSQVLDSHFKRDDERKNTRTSTSVLPADDNAGAKGSTIPSTPNIKIQMGSTSESAAEADRISFSTTGSMSTSVLPADDNAGAKGSNIPSTPNIKIQMRSTRESAEEVDHISIGITGSMVRNDCGNSFPFLDISLKFNH